MKRYRQSFDEILQSLLPVEATWLDEHAEAVIKALRTIPSRRRYPSGDIKEIFKSDFNVGFTIARLFLDKSKDEATIAQVGRSTNPRPHPSDLYKSMEQELKKDLIRLKIEFGIGAS